MKDKVFIVSDVIIVITYWGDIMGINTYMLDTYILDLVSGVTDVVWLVLQFVGVFIVGYILGYIVSKALYRILCIGELQKTLVKYGAVTTNLWTSIANFISQYLKWFITFFVLTTLDIEIFRIFFYKFITPLTVFVVLAISGLLIGGIVQKIIKDTLVSIGLEEGLEKHNVADSLGGVPLSSILATIAKWYTILLFVGTGIERLLPVSLLATVIRDLLAYIPNAIMGILILIAALILGDFTNNRIKRRGVQFSELIAMGAEVVIIFFGIVLALPKLFGVDGTEIFIQSMSVITDSFKFIIMGISIGLAIALGLGLKDSIAKAGIKYEKELVEGK